MRQRPRGPCWCGCHSRIWPDTAYAALAHAVSLARRATLSSPPYGRCTGVVKAATTCGSGTSASSRLRIGVGDFGNCWDTSKHKEVSHEQEVCSPAVG